MLIWLAVAVAAGLTLVSLRAMALAFAASLAPVSRTAVLRPDGGIREMSGAESRLGPTEIWMLVLEILFSIAIMLLIVGFAFAAAMPGHLMVGALLAQMAVLGALFAPAVVHQIGGFNVRPAALALGIAQLAHVAFFIRAMQALVG
ncbi:MAG TPA: hypothetical protein VKZ96_18615 [Thermomicrobiales bacterium]|nr:hypothetical protein [Thermomicrobiales bacterium]